MKWQWKLFEEISGVEMHEILALRQQVFVVEQDCIYLDADNLDCKSWHLIGRAANDKIGAYARLNFAESRFTEPSIGRVLTSQQQRKRGFARKAINMAISKCGREYPGQAVKISAQLYLKDFYGELGFRTISKPYDEDGIEHIDMIREGNCSAAHPESTLTGTRSA